MAQNRSGIICAGNWIVDLVHDIEHWPDESNLTRISAQSRGMGGGAANVVSALARLETGLPLWPMGAIGDDEPGRFILEECRGLGLPTDKLVLKAGTPTAHTHVMSVPGRSRTFFYQGGANDVLSADDFPEGTFAHTPARLFYLGYLSLLGELDEIDANGKSGAATVLERAQRAGLTTVVDLVSLMHPAFHAIAKSAAPYIDYLVVNELEVALAADMSTEEDLTSAAAMSKAAGKLLAMGVAKAVVVHCVERVVWLGADGQELVIDIEPLSTDLIVSNLGAGDAFCAGLIYAIHQCWPNARAIKLANTCARASLRGHTATTSIPPLSELLQDTP